MYLLLTTQEAAARLRVTEQTIRSYIRSGALAAERLNRQHRIRPESIESFLEAQRRGR